MSTTNPPISITPFIREIGRGKDGARSLSEADAYSLMSHILRGEVSDLAIGAAVLALRMKGESVDELRGFLRAAHEHCLPLTHDKPVVIIPSYNGARKLPNLVPLLALLLARGGVSVLVQGVVRDAARTTTYEIFQALGLPVVTEAKDAQCAIDSAFALHEPVFMPIATLSPAIAKLLALRQAVGVRNSGHTISKVLAPFSTACVRLVNYTHPEYATSLSDLFSSAAMQSDVLLMRGTEGEAVADARRSQAIEWFSRGERRVMIEAQQGVVTTLPVLPREIDAVSTATYIQSVLAGEHPVPEPIARQVEAVLQCVNEVANGTSLNTLLDTDTIKRNKLIASI
jgi:anthranilate phosphoribosyltransferase